MQQIRYASNSQDTHMYVNLMHDFRKHYYVNTLRFLY